MADWIDTFLDLLSELRQADTNHSVFGSEFHRYKLKPALDDARLAEIEGRYQCRLPADYRRYLLEVSDGGAGPGTGLYSLNKATEYTDCSGDFPFESEYDFYPPSDGPYCYDDIHRGSLVISHYGCSMFVLLVVRGVSASQVWYDGEDYAKPLATCFSDWLLGWAKSSLNNLRNQTGG